MSAHSLPSQKDLSAWIHPRYFEAYQKGRLHEEWCHMEPFKFAVLRDLFRPEVIAAIEAHCQTIPTEKAKTQGVARHADWYWGAFGQLEVVQFVFGKTFRAFLNTLLDEEMTMKASSIPQYNVFRPGSKGIPIHNDFSEARSGIVCLLQLSTEYQPGLGGELNFFRREKEKLVMFDSVAPVLNTLILFKVSRDSYHSVSDLKGNWKRHNIAFDWYARAEEKVA